MPLPLAVIPARFQASRFPGKPLALISGRPMVLHVLDRCREAACFSSIVVATDDARIATAVQTDGGSAVMTSPSCPTGTDRVAEVAAALKLSDDQVLINVQGDEPAVSPSSLRALASAFAPDFMPAAPVEMATLVRPLLEQERINPNVVKVVRDEAGRALYFSRADVPHARDQLVTKRWGHVGLYGYRAHVVKRLASLAPTALERTESLEQLRALGHGISILCVETEGSTQAVDVPEDVPLAEAALARMTNQPGRGA